MAKKPSLTSRLKAKADGVMAGPLKMCPTAIWMVHHYTGMLMEQLKAMLPITILQVLVLAIFFRKTTPTPVLEAAGLISAVIGLVLFLEGLRVAIMPMAMLVGTQLPQRLKLPFVLVVAFCLGVLVTYAEPAIAAIRPLAALVDPASAPYLYFVMNQQQELMVLAIGIGVGVAAVMGTMKFLYGWSLKPLIAVCLVPTVGLACYMQWGNQHLQPLLGVAWDCGAVTTGPVTVPVLLALGVGVMDAQRQKKAALKVLEDCALKKSEGNTLEGFGIVTLASLLPVLAVELMSVIISAQYPYDYVLEQAKIAAQHAATTTLGVHDQSPVKEVVYAVRAISPLLIALVLLVVVVLRQPLPSKGFTDDDEDSSTKGGSNGADSATTTGSGISGKDAADAGATGDTAGLDDTAKLGSQLGVGSGGKDVADDLERGETDQAARTGKPPSTPFQQSMPSTPSAPNTPHSDGTDRSPSVFAKAVILNTDDKWAEDYYGLEAGGDSVHGGSAYGGSQKSSGSAASGGSQRVRGCLAGLKKYKSLIIAMFMCQIGMILFNLGLTYGFAALGDMTGLTLPAGFLHVDYDPKSPYYSFAGGVTLTMVTIFLLGILATKAEPALNVLGDTVETLSGGKFTKKALIWSVCVGVAVGMCAGACKILFRLPLIWFILVKYAVAVGLTVVARESITAVAWDSAGVTTGPVTVPFVLSIGIGFSKAVGAPEGFGMLTVMSVAPIISVLLTSLMKAPVKAAATTLARVSKLPLQTMSQGLGRLSRPLGKTSKPLGTSSRPLESADSGGRDPCVASGGLDAIVEFRDSVAFRENMRAQQEGRPQQGGAT